MSALKKPNFCRISIHISTFWLITLLLAACTQASSETGHQKLKVVASTTIVGQFVDRVGGEHVDLTVLIPADADPHTFEPRPQDIAAVSEAQIVFINGLGLEESLENILDANLNGDLVEVSEDVQKLSLQENETGHVDDEHEGWDPHTWMDPTNVIQWVTTIENELARLDPANEDDYHANAEKVKAELTELDAWIEEQVSGVPSDRRKLISDHQIFGYFARRYDFELAGLVISSFSTNASPSAQELSQLHDQITREGVPAIFVSHTANPQIAGQIANDLGIKLVPIYAGSLTQPGGDADTYEKYMRYNVTQIVNALK